MGIRTRQIKFNCFNDCLISGCPGHTMEITIQTVSDVLCVDVDGKPWFSSDSNRWEALKIGLESMDYSFFDLKSPPNPDK